MIAPAHRHQRGPASAIRPAALVLFFAAFVRPIPASAQVGAVVSAYTDQRFRGYSLSDGRPVGILDISYDSRGGFYAAASATVVATRGEGLKGLGATLNGGYAKRIRPNLTLDLGAVHSRYSHYSDLVGARSYTELYGGVTGQNVGARLSISPNYIGPAHWTAHGEINGHVDLTRRLLLDGSLGILAPLGRRGYQGSARPQWDARLGLAQRLGPIVLHAAITARAKSPEIYVNRQHHRAALVLGISSAL